MTHYRFDSVHVVRIVPFGVQTGVSLGFDSRGTVTEETYDATGAAAGAADDPVRADVRGAPGDGGTMAQRGRAAAGGRRLIGDAARVSLATARISSADGTAQRSSWGGAAYFGGSPVE